MPAEEGKHMNIRKKLYLSFGGILGTVGLLAAVILFAVYREHDTKAAAQRSMDMTQATSMVRFEMMQNRLHLQNYLLSGDTRDLEKMNDGVHRLTDVLRRAQGLANSDQQRASLEKVQQFEQSWGVEFANPLAEKRRQVDSGNATVAELQIFYLQKDPNSWVSRSSDVLDQVDQLNLKLLEERRRSDEVAATFTVAVTLIISSLALGVGMVIAYRTSKAITDPLTRLIHVAEQIGDSGDLDHTIDVKGQDEIGQLARTFDAMVKYLKEMAAVSEAMGTSTRADVIRRLYAALPQVRAWIDQLLETHSANARKVSTLGFNRLASCYPAELLERARVVSVERTPPFPPVFLAPQQRAMTDPIFMRMAWQKAPGDIFRKIGRPIEGGLNTLAACESADVRDPFLGLRLGCGSGLCRKLEHCCFLTFKYVGQQHGLPVWKFQRIMMRMRVVLVDLPEDGRRVIDCTRFPAERAARPTTYFPGKGKLRSRKNTNCCVGIFRRSEPTSAGIEVAGGQFVPNLGRT